MIIVIIQSQSQKAGVCKDLGNLHRYDDNTHWKYRVKDHTIINREHIATKCLLVIGAVVCNPSDLIIELGLDLLELLLGIVSTWDSFLFVYSLLDILLRKLIQTGLLEVGLWPQLVVEILELVTQRCRCISGCLLQVLRNRCLQFRKVHL